ncbi:MAG: ferredoxin-thioredoxin reductase catalytic domain-containing protein, partial [Prevotella sp.]
MDSISIRAYLEQTSKERYWTLQPNEDILKSRIAAMKKRQAAGRIICPCKGFIDQYTTPESFCPCPDAEGDIKRDGCCHCNVFLAGDEE